MQYKEKNKNWNDRFGQIYGYYSQSTELMSKNITFAVTEQCNMRCSYCYEKHKNSNRMSWEVAKQGVDMILNDELLRGYIDSSRHHGVVIDFMGGEPLLEIDLIDKIASYFKAQVIIKDHPWKNKFVFNISTNGLLYLTKEVQDFISRNKNILSIGITIDGNKELHDSCRVDILGNGTYDRVVEAIKHRVSHFSDVHTKVTYAPENIDKIADAIIHLFDLGITDVFANAAFENIWSEKDSPIFYKELKKLADIIIDNEYYKEHYCSLFDENIGHPMIESDNRNWCGGDGNMLTIGTDGRLYPCFRYMELSLNNQPPITIGDVWNGIDMSDPNFCECCKITRRSQSTDECFYCPIAQGCAWCSGYNYDEFGTPNKRATYICGLHKARVLANHYYWNKLYKKLGIDKKFELYLSSEEVEKLNGKN